MIENSFLVFTGGIVVISSVAIYIYTKLNQKKEKKTLLDSSVKYSLPLIKKFHISHDTRKFRFGLPSNEHVLGLPIGQHVYLSAQIDGKLVVRSYTPVSCDEDKGFVEIMVKVYFKNQNDKFPDGGKMSQHLENMKIGNEINFRGPRGSIIYLGNGRFDMRGDKKSEPKTRFFKEISMIAGGTGITPMLQVIKSILRDPKDATKIRLLFANHTEQDILCREELDELAERHPERFRPWYTVSRHQDNWDYSTGRINMEMIQKNLFGPGSESIVLICGPPSMINCACIPNLENLGHAPENRFIF